VSDLFEQPEAPPPAVAGGGARLIPAHIAYRRELNEAEQRNIARAQEWALNRRREALTEKFIKTCTGGCSATYGDGREVQDRRTEYRDCLLGDSRSLRQLLDDAKRDRVQHVSARRGCCALPSRLVQIHPSPMATAATRASWRIFWR